MPRLEVGGGGMGGAQGYLAWGWGWDAWGGIAAGRQAHGSNKVTTH